MAEWNDGDGDAAGPGPGLNGQVNCALIVEDEFIIAEALRVQLEQMGITVCGVAATADDALALALEMKPTLVLMDVRLQGLVDGVDTAFAIREEVGSKVIFITGSREQTTIDRIDMHHTAPILFKPVSPVQLRRTITRMLS
jgi:DNA-binding NarL/FixJ family response regulator